MILAQDWMHRLWFKEANSAEAHATDGLYMFILWVSIGSFVLLMGLMVWFAWKFRRNAPAGAYRQSAAHNTPLELAWSIIPLLVMVVIFFYGFMGYVNKLAAPPGAEEIRITGQRWSWQATYDNGGVQRDYKRFANVDSPVLCVPVGRPVKLVMTSTDVIHSFYIPAFRMKMDVFPNRYTSFNFTPEREGEHEAYCAEYCGQKHSEMGAWIKVVPEEEFQAFKKRIVSVDPNATPVQRGEFYWSRFGCRSCHTTDGKAGTGPTWQNLYGYEREFTDGSTQVADDNYIRESIYDPKAKIREGYTPQMNSYQGLVSLEQLDDLIAFMKSLSDKGPAPAAAPEAPPETGEPVRDLPTDPGGPEGGPEGGAEERP